MSKFLDGMDSGGLTLTTRLERWDGLEFMHLMACVG